MKRSLKIKIRNNEKFLAIFRGQLSGSIFLGGIFRRSILQGAIFWRAYFRGTFFQEQWTWSLFCLTKFLTIPVKTSVSNRSAIGTEKKTGGLDFSSKSRDYHNSWGLNKKEEGGKGVQIVSKTHYPGSPRNSERKPNSLCQINTFKCQKRTPSHWLIRTSR